MYGVICVYSATSAGIHLLNVTTGAGRSFTVPVDADVLSAGTAWWMLEVPNFEAGPSRLPRYGDVYFDNCIAETSDNALLSASSGHYIPFPRPNQQLSPFGYTARLDSNGQEISMALVETDRLFKVVYTGP
jgi:Peptidase A4 family